MLVAETLSVFKAVQATYNYDGLNRVTTVSYNDGTTPASSYCYDGFTWTGTACGTTQTSYEWMRRTAAANSVSYTNFTYDLAGRPTGNTQTTGGTAGHGFGYSYYNDDSLAGVAYPSQRSVVNCYDA